MVPRTFFCETTSEVGNDIFLRTVSRAIKFAGHRKWLKSPLKCVQGIMRLRM